MRRLAIPGGLMLTVLACARATTETTPAPKPEPAPVFVEAQPRSCDGTLAAIIGDHAVPIASFEHIYELKLLKYTDRGRTMPKTADARYHKSISERVIYQEILALETAKLGLDDDPTALEQREQRQKRGIADWAKHLRRRGESDESLRALYIAELHEHAILQASGALTVSEEEIAAEYERIAPDYVSDGPRVRAAHILIRIDPDRSEADALARAEAIYQQAIQPDADFAQLAQEHSAGPSSTGGGDLGIFTADHMVPEFSKPVFALKPGEISHPIKTKFGYHVVKVYGVWGPGQLPREALEPQIVERLAARKLHAGRRELEARLLAEYGPTNCVRLLAEARGLDWPPDPKTEDPAESESTGATDP